MQKELFIMQCFDPNAKSETKLLNPTIIFVPSKLANLYAKALTESQKLQSSNSSQCHTFKFRKPTSVEVQQILKNTSAIMNPRQVLEEIYDLYNRAYAYRTQEMVSSVLGELEDQINSIDNNQQDIKQEYLSSIKGLKIK